MRDLAKVYGADGIVAFNVSWAYDPVTYRQLDHLEPVEWSWNTPTGQVRLTAREQELLAPLLADPALQEQLQSAANGEDLVGVGFLFQDDAPQFVGHYRAQSQESIDTADLPAAIPGAVASLDGDEDDEEAVVGSGSTNTAPSRDTLWGSGQIAPLRESGFTGVRATYGGGGDSGSVEEVVIEGVEDPTPEQDEAASALADWVTENLGYDWYNNEGGGGTFVVQPDGQIVFEEAFVFEDTTEMSVSKLAGKEPLTWGPVETRAVRRDVLTRLLADKKLERDRRVNLVGGLEILLAGALADPIEAADAEADGPPAAGTRPTRRKPAARKPVQ